LGQSTRMEAEIGVVYQERGLRAAFDFMEKKWRPVFKKQRRNRVRSGSWRLRK